MWTTNLQVVKDVDVKKPEIKYHNVFILFIIGCVLGVLLEGSFCYIMRGQWETHVTFLWGPFNIVYGLGAVVMYLASVKLNKKSWVTEFIWFSVLGSAVEWLMGFIQDKMFNSYSWTYNKLAIGKYVSIPFAIAWGLLGLIFIRVFMPVINKGFTHTTSKRWKDFANVFTVFMCINLALSVLVFTRWGERAQRPNPRTKIGAFIDNYYPDEVLQSRFVEWKMNETEK